MRDARRYGLALALVAVGCGPPKPLPPPDLSSVTESFAPAKATVGDALGVAGQLHFDATRAAQLDRIGMLGTRVVRRDFLWQDLEPTEGTFDFAAEDAAVDDSRARGLSTIGILAYDTTWASPDGDIDSPPPIDKFAAFAQATAQHFAGRVDAWEIWNEPNVGYRFWKPREDGGAYAKLLVAAHDAVKRGNPHATVILAGLFYHYEGVVTDAVSFLEDAFTAVPDLGKSFDALGLHPYPHYPPQASPEANDGREQPVGLMLARVRAELAYYGAPKPIWVTEYGWPVYGTVDEAGQARFVVRGAVEAMAAGAERVCLYTLDDGPNPTAYPPEDAFGLFRNDGTAKPSATAIANVEAMLGGMTLVADESAPPLRRYVFSDGNRRVAVSYSDDAASDPMLVAE